jgi:hypothetical protein
LRPQDWLKASVSITAPENGLANTGSITPTIL